MQQILSHYSPAIFGFGVFGVIYLLQLVVADFAALRQGHTPGTSVEQGHDNFLFRATRAHANTSESIGAFILIGGFAVAAGGAPTWVNGLVWAFIGLRVGHMLAYYFDQRQLRSAVFGLSMLCLFVLFTVGARAL
jgi:uncharacterized MAPEG superfamily protein